ncbi:6,7-dimethyl-8-ribityllumazine synthase [Bdellovibrio sp. HCB337]|uniref:6,7-dimethyl-8-ribityllumazine synthase n=1 Tax=Bdellovibrio sp. HCB337 TaxID=3394358 RepID=UPI0039A51A5A
MKQGTLKIGVVTARFNSEVTDKLEEGALSYLEEFDLEILAVKVPGAVEIPLACKALFDIGCHGVVALGAVIRGETSHYDYVCNSVERGVTALMLEYKRPIGFGVLTTENDEQAMDRAGGKHGNKGAESAQVVMEMMGLLEDLEQEGGKKATPAKTAKKSVKKPTKKAKKK